jgi:hypothetical protein
MHKSAYKLRLFFDGFAFANIKRVQLLLHLSIMLLVFVALSDSYIPLNLKYHL